MSFSEFSGWIRRFRAVGQAVLTLCLGAEFAGRLQGEEDGLLHVGFLVMLPGPTAWMAVLL